MGRGRISRYWDAVRRAGDGHCIQMDCINDPWIEYP